MSPEDHLAAILHALGYDRDPEAARTPERVLDLLRSFAPDQPAPAIEGFPSPSGDPVLLRGLPFHSLCVHHLLPFFGTADIAYLPTDRIAGLGSLTRALRHEARQPQLQERLGARLADRLHDALGGAVVVRLRARQMCMELRGVESAGTVETIAARGDGRQDLLRLLG